MFSKDYTRMCTQWTKQPKRFKNSGTIPTESEFKPGRTSIITFGKTAGRVKKQGKDPLGRWSYQVLNRKGNTDILIIGIYQCCKSPTNKIGMTAYHQQKLMLSDLYRKYMDPLRNFLRNLKLFFTEEIK